MKRTLLGLAGAALATTLVASPAHAEFYKIDDPADAGRSLADITTLYVRHSPDDVVVRVRFEDLRRSSKAGMSVLIDTDPDRRGPEFVLGTGLGDGTDYALTRARRWRSAGEHLQCAYSNRLRWRRDVARIRISHECLGDPDRLRVTVKMVDPVAPGDAAVDWAPTRRHWTPWIESGLGG